VAARGNGHAAERHVGPHQLGRGAVDRDPPARVPGIGQRQQRLPAAFGLEPLPIGEPEQPAHRGSRRKARGERRARGHDRLEPRVERGIEKRADRRLAVGEPGAAYEPGTRQRVGYGVDPERIAHEARQRRLQPQVFEAALVQSQHAGDRAEPQQPRVGGRALDVAQQVREVVHVARVEPADVQVVARLEAEEGRCRRHQHLPLCREGHDPRVDPGRGRCRPIRIGAAQQSLRGAREGVVVPDVHPAAVLDA